MIIWYLISFFFFQAEDGIRDTSVTGVQTCALPISIADAGHAFLVELVIEEGAVVADHEEERDAIMHRSPNRRHPHAKIRSEERRVGKECRYRWSTDH